MAEFGANLNQANQVTGRPSIFDLLAQESLMSSLRPAFEFSIRTFANSYPEKFGSIFKYSDEIFYFLVAAVEKHFLWTHCASFSENFYGLKRIPISRKMAGHNVISSMQKVASLISLTAIPYLKVKLEKYYAVIKEDVMSEQSHTREFSRLNKTLLRWFPLLHTILEGTKLAMIISYVINLIDIHSPVHALLRVALTYSDPSNEDASSKHDAGINGSSSLLKRLIGITSSGCSFAIEYALPMTVFFLKFVEWWYSSESSPHNTMDFSPIPPPPKELQVNIN